MTNEASYLSHTQGKKHQLNLQGHAQNMTKNHNNDNNCNNNGSNNDIDTNSNHNVDETKASVDEKQSAHKDNVNFNKSNKPKVLLP